MTGSARRFLRPTAGPATTASPPPATGTSRSASTRRATARPAHRELPACHRVAALLKRWLLGTHQGGVNHEQLDAYLDEFVFRFNRRSSRSIGLRFTACSQARCRPRRARTRPSSPHRLPDPTPSIEVRQGDSPLQANPRDRIYEPYAFA